MSGYEDPYNQANRQVDPYTGQPLRNPPDTQAVPQPYGVPAQGSSGYPPVNQPTPPYGVPAQGSGGYPPVNQPTPPYGAPVQGSGGYPPVNQPTPPYGAPAQGSGGYPPVNQPAPPYGAPVQGSSGYPPVNQPSASQAPFAEAPQPEDGYQTPEGWPQLREMQDRNPFDETGFDPSLRDMRATHLMKHNDPFWEDFETLKKKQRKRAKQEAKQQRKAEKAASLGRTGSHAGRKALLGLAIVCVIVIGLGSALYRVREIEVRGPLYTFTQQEVAEIAGIRMGQSMADIDAEDVAAHVSSNRYLIFRSVETEPLSKVILTVKEREPAAVLTFNGTKYLIDHRGMVLEESPGAEETFGLPVVGGIQVKGNYGCMVGSILKTETSAQFDTLCAILLELKVQSAERTVTSINIANLESILMETVVGYGVSLGDDTYIHGKIKAMLYVMGSLAEQGLGPGTIDVSNRQQPTYIPD